MKADRSFAWSLLAVTVALLSGCANPPPAKPMSFTGTWTNRLGTIWTLKADGTFDVDLDHRGKPEAWGRYRVEGDTVIVIGSGGLMPKRCKGEGIYRFHRNGNTLRFALVRDDCKLRRANLLTTWQRR